MRRYAERVGGGWGGISGGVMVGGVCVTIHGLRMRVSGWGELEGGGSNTIRAPRGVSDR